MTLTTTGLRAAADRLIAAAAGPLQCDPLVFLTAARSPKNLPFGGRAAERFGPTVGAVPKTAP
ncbi:MAG: hypothetical protein QOI29_2381 [Mycobacterium sp.]|jgi:hypothetical protein|nr:hypothetical protein [Mycobacterium sp.]